MRKGEELSVSSLIKQRVEEIGEGCKEKGWDSYDAHPVKSDVVDKAKRIFSDIFICPLNDGSIALSFDDERIVIEVEPDLSLHVILLDEKVKVDRVS